MRRRVVGAAVEGVTKTILHGHTLTGSGFGVEHAGSGGDKQAVAALQPPQEGVGWLHDGGGHGVEPIPGVVGVGGDEAGGFTVAVGGSGATGGVVGGELVVQGQPRRVVHDT